MKDRGVREEETLLRAQKNSVLMQLLIHIQSGDYYIS